MDLDKLRSFCELVKAGGSLHEAENVLKIKYATLRKQILNLEKELGIKLIENLDNKIIISDEGEKFFSYANEILNFTDKKLAEYEEDKQTISSHITIATTTAIAAIWLTDGIAEFNKHYPSVQITVKASDESFDLFTREADVSIFAIENMRKGLISLPLTNYHMNLYASESYLAEKGTPHSIEDLAHHIIISYGNDVQFPFKQVNWHLQHLPNGKEPNISINSGVGIFQLVEKGVGIGSVSQAAAERSSTQLIRILPDLLEGPNISIGLCFPESRANSKTIKTLYEYLKDKF